MSGRIWSVTAEQQLELAKKHLLRVKEAWDPPTWDDLSAPELDAEDVASRIERYVEAVEAFLREAP
jgi:hypothetical protein